VNKKNGSEATVLKIKKNIVCLFFIGFFWSWISLSQVWAEEVGVHYQVLGEQQGVATTTTTLILELWNLSGNDINNLTINRATFSPSLPDEGAIRVGTLTTTESKMIQASFSIPNDYFLADEVPLKFYLNYETADGIPRSAVVQGQPTVFIGNPTP
jgi:hypothetical protein